MKITRKGSINPVVYVGTCAECGCQVECSYEEILVQYTDWCTSTYSVRCPTNHCGRTIYLKEARKA